MLALPLVFPLAFLALEASEVDLASVEAFAVASVALLLWCGVRQAAVCGRLWMATDSLLFCHNEKMEEEGENLGKGHPRIATPSRREQNFMKKIRQMPQSRLNKYKTPGIGGGRLNPQR